MKSLSVQEINKLRKAAGQDIRKPMTATELKELTAQLTAKGCPINLLNKTINDAQREAAAAQSEDEAAAQAAQAAADEKARLKALPKDLRQLVKSGATSLDDAERVANNTDLNAWRESLSPTIREGIAAGIITENEVYRSQKGTDMPTEEQAAGFEDIAAGIAAAMGVK